MRRKDRQVSTEAALSILKKGEYGVMSMLDSNHYPYGIPLNFCVLRDRIYFHCALVGKKIDRMESNSRVSFCVVGSTEVLPEKFGTKYESSIITGSVEEVHDEEKRDALLGLVEKYASEYLEEGLKYIDSLFVKTRVFAITIESISGKSRG